MDRQEYLTSDAAAKPYFVHRSLGSFEITSSSINSVMLYADTPHDNVSFYDQLCYYAIRSGFKHLGSCPSDHNEILVGNLLSLQDLVATHHLQFASHNWSNERWLSEVRQLALYVVTRFGHLSMLQHYLGCHPVEATEEDNPLVYAALYSDPPRVRLYLDNDLDVNVEGPIYDGWNVYKISPLVAAARNQTSEYQEPLVQLILAQGCTVPEYVVHSALQCRAGAFPKPAVIRILLDHGADPTLLAAGSKSALHLLLERSMSLSDDDFAIARMLVTAGCDPLALDDRGFSPFHHVIIAEEIAWIQWLLQNGFQFPSDAILSVFRGSFSSTQYITAIHMMQFLIANNVDVQVRDIEGCNVFHHLARLIFIDDESMAVATRLLASEGCDINCKNESGETPLQLIAAHRSRLDHIELLVAYGAQLPIDIVSYSARMDGQNFLGGDHYLTNALIPLAKKYGASCQSITVGGDNALHSMLKSDALFPHASLPIAKFLLENGCDIRATNSWGATPILLAIENGHLSTAELVLSQLSASSVDSNSIIPHVMDSEGNGILHCLCRKLQWLMPIDMDEFIDRLTMLQEAGHDLAEDVNRQDHKGFTPLCIILGAGHDELTPASDSTIQVISVLLYLGAEFSEVIPFYKDNFEWATNLPWYRDATEAHRLSLSRFNPRFGDVTWALCLLQRAHLPKIPPPIVMLIMNMAEYWAYTKVIKRISATRSRVVVCKLHFLQPPVSLSGHLAELRFPASLV